MASGTADGTYYYDVRSPCPQDFLTYYPLVSPTMCESYTPEFNPQTLRQRNSNNIIAIGQLLTNPNLRPTFCGKQVIVTYKGKQVKAPDGGDFVVWDGCEACAINFSVSGLRAVNSQACKLGVVPGVSYQITSVQVIPFIP